MNTHQSFTDFYQLSTIRRVIDVEEKKGRLKESYFSEETNNISHKLRTKRDECRKLSPKKRGDVLLEIEDLKDELNALKEKDFESVCLQIASDKQPLTFHINDIKGKKSYCASDLATKLVCQLVKEELRHAYRLTPADRNDIVEEMSAMLDCPMRQTVIRADIKEFFESIPQTILMCKLVEDGYLSSRTIKYIKRILYKYNEDTENDKHIGIPRGLAFSSYLAEIYLDSIDMRIRGIDGIYFYRRYVDDLIVMANTDDKCGLWDEMSQVFMSKGLVLHEESGKRYVGEWSGETDGESFDYLGYHWSYAKEHLQLSIKEAKIKKYISLIDDIFETYIRTSHFCSRKANTAGCKHKKDPLMLLFRRLKVLTGNGLLSGRKNYVATGIFFSNKYITDFSGLDVLDKYLCSRIDLLEFHPGLFNYGNGISRGEIIKEIKEHLHELSFRTGFEKRDVQHRMHFSQTLRDIKRIHIARNNHG